VYISHGAGVSRALRERRSALGAPGREPRPHPGPTRPATRPGAGGNSGLPLAEGRTAREARAPRPAPTCPSACGQQLAPAPGAWLGLGPSAIQGPGGVRGDSGGRIMGRHVWKRLARADQGERELAPTARATRHFEVLNSSRNGFDNFEWRSHHQTVYHRKYSLFGWLWLIINADLLYYWLAADW